MKKNLITWLNFIVLVLLASPTCRHSNQVHGRRIGADSLCSINTLPVQDSENSITVLRELPTVVSEVVTSVPTDTVLSVIDTTDKGGVTTVSASSSSVWIKASYQNQTGWISMLFVKLGTGCDDAMLAKLRQSPLHQEVDQAPPIPVPEIVSHDMLQEKMPIADDWVWPVNGKDALDQGWVVTLRFLSSWTSNSGIHYLGHLAIDLGSENNFGRQIFAAANGKVAAIHRSLGNYLDVVVIEHQLPTPTSKGDTIVYSAYGHGHGHAVGGLNVGKVVEKGEHLTTLGDPKPFAPHLHLEIYNRSVFESGPFCRGCPARSISPGYAQQKFPDSPSFFHHPASSANGLFYNPEQFIKSDGRL